MKANARTFYGNEHKEGQEEESRKGYEKTFRGNTFIYYLDCVGSFVWIDR